jgi:glutamine amidotransferase
MIAALKDAVIDRGKPFLGICVGMQLLGSVGREFGDHPGLAWIEGEVVKLAPSDSSLKIPHMGWNELKILRAHPVLAGIDDGAHAYFVHSFELRTTNPANLLATSDYGSAVTAAIARDNIVGTQFHPEKSQAVGLRLLANFLGWHP